LKQGRQRRAKQQKDTWIKYESNLAEYNSGKSEREIEEGQAASTPYDKIQEALEELRATSHPNEKQEQLRDFLRSTIFKTNDGKATSHEQEDQNQRKYAFERLGPSGSHNGGSQRNHSQNNRVEQPRKDRSRAPTRMTTQNYSRQDDSW